MTRLSGSLVAAALLVLTAACGSSPSNPSSALSLSGTWTGTWQYVTAGATVADTVTATLGQNGSTASGPWTASSGASGQLSLSVASSATGTISINLTLISSCSSGSVALTGTETATTLDFTLAPIPAVGACNWPTGNHFVLTKQ
jgi:hypothetical protein